MAPLLVKLVLAPSLAGAAAIAARRWGPRVGGVVSAFPAIVGPVLLIAALEHGTLFAARTADGTLLGLAGMAGFALAYGRAARRHRWPLCLGLGWAAAALAELGVARLGFGGQPLVDAAVASLSLLIAARALPRSDSSAAPSVHQADRTNAILLRMAVTALLVSGLSAAVGLVGALAGGMLTALPVLASVLAVFAHRQAGPHTATQLLRGALSGMAGFVAFCILVAVVAGPYGTLPAFAAATAAAVIIQASMLQAGQPFRLRRRRSVARPA